MIEKPGQRRKCLCILSTSDLNLHKSLSSQTSRMVVLKVVQETAMVCQVILGDLRRFVAEMLRKIKFDFPPGWRFLKIISL